MSEMLTLMGDHLPCPLFEFTSLQQLPQDLRQQLMEESFEDPIQLAARADELWISDQQQVDALENLEQLESPESLDRIDSMTRLGQQPRTTTWQAQRPRTTPTRGPQELQTRQVAQE